MCRFRATTRALALAALLCGLSLCGSAQSRRAILVGIDTYNPDDGTRAEILKLPRGATLVRPAVKGDPTYWRFDNLDGALNDVHLMRGVLESFGFTDFVVLTNQDATADAILSALRKNMIEDAHVGDIRVFYYSGHGNHIPNTATKEEDQTIVPADNWRNVGDVRDKEISRILWQAARNGVKVTFIADSCHSGSLSRGAWNARGKARTTRGPRDSMPGAPHVKLTEPVVDDPPSRDPDTKQPIDPEKLGVLTLAAAQSNEEALESNTEDGPHGAFTWALCHALRNPDEPMSRIFERITTQMRGDGVPQQPVMGGAGRASKGFFGQNADPNSALTLLVESVDGKDVKLRGGTAIGLYPGSTLKSVAGPPVTLEVVAPAGLSASTAHTKDGPLPKAKDVFKIETWAAPPKAALRVYVPNPAPAATVREAAEEIGKLQTDPAVAWLADATTERPAWVMSWNGEAWILESNPAQGPRIMLGAHPTAEIVKSHLPPGAKFLLLLPPTPELEAALHLGEGANAGVQTNGKGAKNTPAGAPYWFYGRVTGKDVEYAWLLADSTEASVRERAGQDRKAWPGGYLPLPVRSDWVKLDPSSDGPKAAGQDLADKALLLARIRAWFTLESPPGNDSFPYHLALQNTATKEFRDVGDLRGGENYKLYLRADPARLANPQTLKPRWVYVFVVDHFGKGSLLFPVLGHGNEGNHLPFALPHEPLKFEPLIPLTGADVDADFSISEPFGVDSYFLLTSDEPIDNPEVLDFEGLRTRGARGPSGNPLTELLEDTGAATRGAKARVVPANWSIESFTYRSVEP